MVLDVWTAQGEAPTAGAPAWVQALGIVAGVVTVLAPLLLVRRRKSSDPEPSADDTTGETPPTPPRRQPIERATDELTLVERMLANLEREQERDRQEAVQLREALTAALAANTALEVRAARLEADLESRERTIARLRQQVEHYQWTHQQQTPPRWPAPPPPPTRGR